MLQYAPVCWRFVLARFGGRLCCHQSQHQSLLPSELELGEWVMLIRQPRWPRWVGWHGQPMWTRCLSGVQVVSPVNQDAQVVSTAVLLEQCPRKGVLLEQCPSGQHSSAVGLVVGMSTMIPNMCPPRLGKLVKWFPRWCTISVHQGWSRRPRCQVVSKLVKYQIQCGKYEDQVGQQQKQWIQTDVREIKLPCQDYLVSYVHIGWMKKYGLVSF